MRRLFLLALLLASPLWAADGDVKFKSNTTALIRLVDPISCTSTTTGQWVSAQEYREALVSVTGTVTTATITVNGSLAQTIPANSSAGDYTIKTFSNAGGQVSIGITADASADALRVMPRWIKAAVTVCTTGTSITVDMIARKANTL